MKKDIRLRVSSLIRKLNYSEIQLKRLNVDAVRNWCYINLPNTIKKFTANRFDLNEATTWEEIVAYNTILQIYGRKVAIYFTFSWLDFQGVKEFIQSKKGAKFREDFGIEHHSAILLSPEIFFKPESIDEFWVSFDLKSGKGYNFLDYSHYNDDDDVDSDMEEYQWLNEALAEQASEKIPTPRKRKTKNNVITQ